MAEVKVDELYEKIQELAANMTRFSMQKDQMTQKVKTMDSFLDEISKAISGMNKNAKIKEYVSYAKVHEKATLDAFLGIKTIFPTDGQKEEQAVADMIHKSKSLQMYFSMENQVRADKKKTDLEAVSSEMEKVKELVIDLEESVDESLQERLTNNTKDMSQFIENHKTVLTSIAEWTNSLERILEESASRMKNMAEQTMDLLEHMSRQQKKMEAVCMALETEQKIGG